MGIAFDGTLTPEQVEQFGKDGFLVLPDFASPEEVKGMLSRADELVDAFDPATVPRSIFTTKHQKRTSDAYFLDSGNHLSFFFEEDAFASMNRHSWDLHMETNLRGPLVLAQAFARRITGERQGLIVNILDQRVLRTQPAFFSYSLSKAALWEATRMMALALAPRVRVNGIGPGPVLASIHQTPDDFAEEAASTPLARAVDPREIAQALRYLIDAPSVTGQMIAIDSGQHLA